MAVFSTLPFSGFAHALGDCACKFICLRSGRFVRPMLSRRNNNNNPTTLHANNACDRPAFVASSGSALKAEWEKEWKESDFEADLAKLQKEAEERLDEKISELQANIEKTGV